LNNNYGTIYRQEHAGQGIEKGDLGEKKRAAEQFSEKFGVAFSDGDICIFHYNINIGNMPTQPY
jgi:hypothetical protein